MWHFRKWTSLVLPRSALYSIYASCGASRRGALLWMDAALPAPDGLRRGVQGVHEIAKPRLLVGKDGPSNAGTRQVAAIPQTGKPILEVFGACWHKAGAKPAVNRMFRSHIVMLASGTRALQALVTIHFEPLFLCDQLCDQCYRECDQTRSSELDRILASSA